MKKINTMMNNKVAEAEYLDCYRGGRTLREELSQLVPFSFELKDNDDYVEHIARNVVVDDDNVAYSIVIEPMTSDDGYVKYADVYVIDETGNGMDYLSFRGNYHNVPLLVKIIGEELERLCNAQVLWH